MTRAAIATEVYKAIQEVLPIDIEELTPEAQLVEDLGADSLDVIEIVMGCEEELGIAVPDDDAETLTTVGALIDYFEERLRACA